MNKKAFLVGYGFEKRGDETGDKEWERAVKVVTDKRNWEPSFVGSKGPLPSFRDTMLEILGRPKQKMFLGDPKDVFATKRSPFGVNRLWGEERSDEEWEKIIDDKRYWDQSDANKMREGISNKVLDKADKVLAKELAGSEYLKRFYQGAKELVGPGYLEGFYQGAKDIVKEPYGYIKDIPKELYGYIKDIPKKDIPKKDIPLTHEGLAKHIEEYLPKPKKKLPTTKIIPPKKDKIIPPKTKNWLADNWPLLAGGAGLGVGGLALYNLLTDKNEDEEEE